MALNTKSTAAAAAEHAPPLEVFYDGSCPLCRSEIAFLEKRDKADQLAFRDISQAADGSEVAPGLTRQTAMARMHVRLPSGQVRSGARAFLEMWGRIPMLRPFVRILRVPPLPWLMEGAYRAFLVVRPGLQWIARGRS